ncbi:MFS transporter, FLVCR family, feline leukemia virus subgroup C receptor-related protein [Clostridium acidisoli DSM 12555]|uniref:MFS transporter, FLVCR family, feline leukemia virus subgroup C receptor-related protein n=1 Tax=Clostridium acidisoli DSM 12555 TaxID=1121291 RepID=A0A1W1WXZ4_9CLOT|nr:MFS transporter [Clostridium acidisoli]SMC16599.1 MFS transporter, FLVCR family, feline leukemia virus subgroup C receptor-related protein [Clostridium acidisoli DSM 12555]
MTDTGRITYKYRWVILAVFSIINAVIQMQWLTFASVAIIAQKVYKVSSFQIDSLSMIFMLVFIVACIPASYIIDRFGIRIGIGIGAILTGIFSLIKGIYADNYSIIFFAQFGLAVAQPFILNATTKIGANWFPIDERAAQAGISSLFQYLGIIFAMVVTPLLVTYTYINGEKVYDLKFMLMFYAIMSIISVILVLLFLKEKPPIPPAKESSEKRLKTVEGILHMLKQRDMIFLLVIFFFGLGMFNAISTCIDKICGLKALDANKTGIVGGVMLIGGVAGACILPALSDKFKKRKLFLILPLLFSLPGLLGLTFANTYIETLIASFIFGFFLMSAAPIGFQYSAEISFPASESLSQGLIILSGQISGLFFIVAMNMFSTQICMYIFILLTVVSLLLSFIIKESPMILSEESKAS